MLPTAVLLSGGLDSAVLLLEEARRGEVHPIYVAVGLAWEPAERAAVERLLRLPMGLTIRPLVTLSVDMSDVYPPSHWAIEGRPPAYDTPDADVYLPGRNVVLLGKAGVYCAAAGIGRLVVGTLGGNPFPDATADFRAAMSTALSLGLGHDLRVEAPYAETRKADIITRAVAFGLPFELTLSCMSPGRAGVHCGRCSKCRERHDAFIEAGVPDPTVYVTAEHTNRRRG